MISPRAVDGGSFDGWSLVDVQAPMCDRVYGRSLGNDDIAGCVILLRGEVYKGMWRENAV